MAKITLFNRLKKLSSTPFGSALSAFFVGALILGGVGAGATWGICLVKANRALKKADEQLIAGRGALAAETLDPYRHVIKKDERACKIMISAYYAAHTADRLEWASQACIEAGNELPESYLGLAAAKEFTQRDQEALQILNNAVEKFPDTPDMVYRLGQVLRRNKRDDGAVSAFKEAMRRAPQNQQLALEVLDYLAFLERWQDAAQIARNLKSMQTENPEIKLLLARSLQRGGSPDESRGLVAEAQALLVKTPRFKEAIEKAYADVLNFGSGASGAPAN